MIIFYFFLDVLWAFKCYDTFWTFASCDEISTLTSELIELAHQIEGVGFDSLKQDDLDELWADEPLTDVNVISLADDNKKNVDSEKSDFEESFVQFNSIQIGPQQS